MSKNWKRQFVTIYAGQAFSLVGSAAVQFAVIWQLTIQTESAMVLGIASIIAFLPYLFIGPFAGVIIDRFNRRTVMIASDGLVALSSVVLGVVFIFIPTPPVWIIFVILFIRGLGNTFHAPAMQAAIPMLVPVEMLTKAGGWGNLVHSISSMLGPVLGAALMTFLPMSSIMLVDIIGATFAIVSLLFVTIPSIPRSSEELDLFIDMRQGFKAIKENRPLVAMIIPFLLVSILYMPLGSLYPLFVRVHFMGEAFHNSIVEFTFAGGMLLSSIVIGIWGGMKRRFFMTSLAIGLLGVAAFVSGLLPQNGFWIFTVISFIMGWAGTFFSVPFMAYLQESFAPEVMGKVLSLWYAGMSFTMPLGLLIAGPVSESIGISAWFWISGIAMVVVAIFCRYASKPYDKETMVVTKEEPEIA